MNTSYSSSMSGTGAVIFTLLMLAFYVLVVIGLWKTFVKAGHPGWAAIVPFYNIYIWVKIAGRPTSWFWIILAAALLSWIPIIGWLLLIAAWVMSLFLALDVAKNFGQGTGFGILLWLFSAIMFLVLGFGDYQYRQVAHPEMAGGYAAGQGAPPPAPPAGQPMAPPPPLARPLTPAPLAPPPSQAAPAAAATVAAAGPAIAAEPAEAATQAPEAAPTEVVTEAAEAAPAGAEAVTEAGDDATPEPETPPAPPAPPVT